MKRKILILLFMFIMIIASAACGGTGNQIQVVVPQQTEEPSVLSTVIVLPVTRQDISPYFLPGLSEIGVIPKKAYTIGLIMDQTADDAAWQSEINAIAEAYNNEFDVQIITALTGDNAQKQIRAARDMLHQGIDFLIISPCISQSAGVVGNLCENRGVPYITIGKRMGNTPGESLYICSIESDEYLAGVLTGMSIVDKMTQKYGAARGNIGEIVTAVDDQASQLKSMGIRRVFAEYNELNVVCSTVGGTEDSLRYKAATNVLKAFRENELDGVVTTCDDIALQTLQAVLDTDRDELVGNIWSMGAKKSGLTGVWHGKYAQTVECTCQTGMIALEYALQYLEGKGNNIPPMVGSVTRAFSADTQMQKDAIASMIAELESVGTDVCFEHIGEHKLFSPDVEGIKRFYPKHYFEYGQPELFLAEFEPFTTGKAIYTRE